MNGKSIYKQLYIGKSQNLKVTCLMVKSYMNEKITYKLSTAMSDNPKKGCRKGSNCLIDHDFRIRCYFSLNRGLLQFLVHLGPWSCGPSGFHSQNPGNDQRSCKGRCKRTSKRFALFGTHHDTTGYILFQDFPWLISSYKRGHKPPYLALFTG